MTAKIRVLPAEVVGKIAAGEVIERPASVVKELVENSLDAGSRNIKVEVEEGGRRRIVVMDDGEGMTREDALLALKRHATSKICEEGDLDSIRTLGFRGEALPSISAVSRLRLITRFRDEFSGTSILMDGGQVKEVKETGSPPGTRVEVDGLFYNLPARRKFLRGVRSELAHIIEVVTRMALIHFSAGFVLIHNKRVLFNLPPTQEERSRVRAILGKEVASQSVRVDWREGEREVRGWATVPTYVRGSSKGIYIYVNGRYIKDKLVSHAIAEAYRRFIPAKMYPVVILSLSVPFTEVDVNVHPTKMEVRFQKGEDVHQLVSDSLRRALAHPSEARPQEVLEVKEALSPYPTSPITTESVGTALPPWRMVGQMKGTYIVVEGEEGVMIVDQHAAHERVLYERLKTSIDRKAMPQQHFLFPQLIEVKGEEMQLLLGYRAELARLGLELEEFGDRTLAVKSIPSFLQGEDLKSLLEALSGELAARGEGDTLERVVDRICVLMACRGAIKANKRVHEDEVRSLLREWEGTEQHTTCPHGRPIFVRWSWRELEGWFKRG
ncbi:MAG: DNA mismatch repair endonuclease MutL [Deltaproteobacteria bacterium]|nr:MAG: DNA mismatch repair endonuclease MutL [Deltaproteobacteria bacterium]